MESPPDYVVLTESPGVVVIDIIDTAYQVVEACNLLLNVGLKPLGPSASDALGVNELNLTIHCCKGSQALVKL